MKSSWCPPHPFSNDSQKKLRPGSLSSGQPFSLHPGPCANFFAPKIPTLSYGWNPPPPPPFCDVMPVETVWTFWALALSIPEVWSICCFKHPKCFIIHMFIECFLKRVHPPHSKQASTGSYWTLLGPMPGHGWFQPIIIQPHTKTNETRENNHQHVEKNL